MVTDRASLLRWTIPALLWFALFAELAATYAPLPFGVSAAGAFMLVLTVGGILAFCLPAKIVCPPAALLLLLVLLVPSRLLPAHERQAVLTPRRICLPCPSCRGARSYSKDMLYNPATRRENVVREKWGPCPTCDAPSITTIDLPIPEGVPIDETICYTGWALAD